MSITFRIFSLRNTKRVTKEYKGFFGGVRQYEDTVAAYANTHELYTAIAAFASEVGDRLITITGTPWGENSHLYMSGDVVVWYKQE